MGIRPEGSVGINCRWASRLEGPSRTQGRWVIRWGGVTGGLCPLDSGPKCLGLCLRPGEDKPVREGSQHRYSEWPLSSLVSFQKGAGSASLGELTFEDPCYSVKGICWEVLQPRATWCGIQGPTGPNLKKLDNVIIASKEAKVWGYGTQKGGDNSLARSLPTAWRAGSAGGPGGPDASGRVISQLTSVSDTCAGHFPILYHRNPPEGGERIFSQREERVFSQVGRG